mgnify:FL=1|jgi:hypothetical protein
MKKLYFLLFAPILSFSAQIEGTWKLAPQAAALGVGPSGPGDMSWWANGAGDVTTRACFFDDSIKFEANGTMTHYMDGSTWLETWQGVAAEGCGVPVAPHVGGAATYAYDATAGTLTVNGLGAHIGLAKVNNAGEISNGAPVASTITYQVSFSNGGNTMTADINYGTGWWRFVYERTTPIAVQDYDVAFRVDMSQYTGSLTGGVFVNGTFNGWCGTCNPMTDMGNGSWEVTLPLPPGAIEYKFTIDGWNAQEEFVGGESCTVTNGGFTNRAHTVAGDITLPNVCFASCDACTNDITFAVDMNDYILAGNSTAAGVFLNGTFNGWCGSCTPMDDANGDNVWEVTVPITAGAIEYKFTVDGWNDDEQFAGGEPCTVTNGGFTNRSYTVTTAASIPVVCWESCTECTTGLNEEANNVAIYPNPVNSIMTVKATEAIQQIRILDLTGKEVANFVANGLTQEINVEALKAGIYTIQIATAAGNSSKQFVKK